jgi:hypothetical protein
MEGRNTKIKCDCKGDIGVARRVKGKGKLSMWRGEGGERREKGKGGKEGKKKRKKNETE